MTTVGVALLSALPGVGKNGLQHKLAQRNAKSRNCSTQNSMHLTNFQP
jgi:hypothetical protein